MRSRFPLIIIAALAALAALAVGLVAVAGADDDTDLPPLTAAELLARVAADDEGPQAISGDIAWTNRLFGEFPAFGDDAFAEATQSPLLRDGTGRLWAQGEQARFDAYSQAGDQVIVVDGAAGTAWVYDAVENTARLFEVEGGLEGATADASGETEPALGSPATGAPEPPTPARIADMLAAAARFMTVEVTGESVVAGQDAYLLTMTPAATDTALGSIQAAIDGRTFVPLRVDVNARGAAEPTLSFGFERVSYAAVDDDVFAFSPPAGAEVERQTIDPEGSGHGAKTDENGAGEGPSAGDEPGAGGDRGEGVEPRRDEVRLEARRALLDLEQAGALVDFELHAAEGYTARAFRWAYVFDGGLPLDAGGSPLFGELTGAMGGGDAAGGSPPGTGAVAPETGPAAVLLYGEGFGAIGLAETRTTADLREQLGRLPALFEPLPAGAAEARSLLTPLGGVVLWEEGGVTLVAFGIVPGQDLLEFVESVR
jgi:outer membrane lipoprotein-sorting protein